MRLGFFCVCLALSTAAQASTMDTLTIESDGSEVESVGTVFTETRTAKRDIDGDGKKESVTIAQITVIREVEDDDAISSIFTTADGAGVDLTITIEVDSNTQRVLTLTDAKGSTIVEDDIGFEMLRLTAAIYSETEESTLSYDLDKDDGKF